MGSTVLGYIINWHIFIVFLMQLMITLVYEKVWFSHRRILLVLSKETRHLIRHLMRIMVTYPPKQWPCSGPNVFSECAKYQVLQLSTPRIAESFALFPAISDFNQPTFVIYSTIPPEGQMHTAILRLREVFGPGVLSYLTMAYQVCKWLTCGMVKV